jgi:hypothetical protein
MIVRLGVPANGADAHRDYLSGLDREHEHETEDYAGVARPRAALWQRR